MSAPEYPTKGRDLAVEPIDSDASIGELFGRLGEDVSQLITSQVELARRELKDEARAAVRVGGLFGAGAIAAHLALLLVCFAAAWGLSEIVPEGVAFLIVAVVVGAVAATLMVVGRRRMEMAKDIAPQTVRSLKEDVEWTRQQMK